MRVNSRSLTKSHIENQEVKDNRLKKNYKTLEEFMADFPELTEDDAKEIFQLIGNLSESMRMLSVLNVKSKVLKIAKHVLIICMILMLPCLIFEKNPINYWLWLGASVVTLITGIFIPFFMKFYGRRKK